MLHGYLPSFRAAGHGHNNDKWFEVEETADQYAGAIRFTIAQGSSARNNLDTRRVNVGPTDIGKAIAIFTRAARDQLQIEGLELDRTIRRTADMFLKSLAAKTQRGNGGNANASRGRQPAGGNGGNGGNHPGHNGRDRAQPQFAGQHA